MPVIGIINKFQHGDCTNGGVTGGSTEFAIIVNVPGAMDAEVIFRSPDHAKLMLISHPAGGQYGEILVAAEQLNGKWVKKQNPGMLGPMAGGNSVTFSPDATADKTYTINVHDRFETRGQYEALSR